MDDLRKIYDDFRGNLEILECLKNKIEEFRKDLDKLMLDINNIETYIEKSNKYEDLLLENIDIDFYDITSSSEILM